MYLLFFRLLGQIVDSLDNLIDEWYPGLTCIDPMMGQEVLEILAPCSHCKSKDTFHYFYIQLLGKMDKATKKFASQLSYILYIKELD